MNRNILIIAYFHCLGINRTIAFVYNKSCNWTLNFAKYKQFERRIYHLSTKKGILSTLKLIETQTLNLKDVILMSIILWIFGEVT